VPGAQVLVADDDTLLREGVAMMLERAGYEVVAQVGDAEDLVRRARGLEPDLLVVDIEMPPEMRDDGLRAAIELRTERPGLAVVVLSQHIEAASLMKLLDTGADGVGYLLKQRVSKVDDFLAAVERVREGGSAIDPELISAMMNRTRREDPLAPLTARQRDVLALMAQGRSNKAIAGELFLSEETVQKHIAAIFSALDLAPSAEDHRRVLAVVAYLQAADT
jgi:DNA-binding NarL/FixJ family response regulator